MKYIEKYWIFIVIVFFISALINPAFSMLIIGSLVFYFSINSIMFIKRVQDQGVRRMGKVLYYQVGDDGYKTPVIEFTPTVGESVRAEPYVYASSDLSKIRSYKSKIDTEIMVLYDPDDPQKFIIADEAPFNYIVLSIALIIGLSFIILSIANFLGIFKFD